MIRLAGIGLHGGAACAIELSRTDGPTKIAVGEVSATLADLVLVRGDHGVTVLVGGGGPAIDLVEHALAAVGALGLFRGVRLTIEGGEVPLLDGGARALADALMALEIAPSEAPLRIVAPFVVTVDGSRYEMLPGSEPAVEVDIEFPHTAIGRKSAGWNGDRDDFVTRIAPARTFGFVADHEALVAAGRARGVDLRSVVVFDERGVAHGALAGDDEPARHKLLDLIGDLALFGGPPRGLVRAHRPGHARTHTAIRRGLEVGALVVDSPAPR